MEEIKQIQTIFNKKKNTNNEFGTYGKLYHHTNENLKAYIPDTSYKRILSMD